MTRHTSRLARLLLLTPLLGSPAPAQTLQDPELARATNLIVPQSGTRLLQTDAARLVMSGVDVQVEIAEQVAVVTLDIGMINRGKRVEEGVILLPVPPDVTLRGFDFEGASAEPTAELLPVATARGIYDDIVRQTRDPALLEFAGHNTIRTSVFPVPAGGTQTVRIVYEEILPAVGDRIDFVLPRSSNPQASRIPWKVDFRITASAAISAVYSPTHALSESRPARNESRGTMSAAATADPGSIRLSYLLERDGVNASLYTYPDASVGGGYFLLLGGLPQLDPEEHEVKKREVQFVIDRSGSMRGEKLEQARAAALAVLAGLEEGEAFNVIDYATDVATLFEAPRPATEVNRELARQYIARLESGGGTALDRAVSEALRQDHDEALLPIVFFLTDGLPTTGIREESTIRERAVSGNVHDRRIYTFGVGYDVNAPLLDAIASGSRALSTYVSPEEDVEARVSEVYERLRGPVFVAPELRVLDGAGKDAPHYVADLVPNALSDLYEGEQLLLLGKYRTDEPLIFRFEGEFRGEEREFRFHFETDKASVSNSFVPRLWATRRIAMLVDEIRSQGADPAQALTMSETAPHLSTSEIAEEILALTMRFGVMTEYTAFLARQGTDLRDRAQLVAQLNTNLRVRAQRTRGGRGAVNQAVNNARLARRTRAGQTNRFLDENMREVSVQNVHQLGDRTYYRRGKTWVEGRLHRLGLALEVADADRIALGSDEHRMLVTRLIADGRESVLGMRGEIWIELDGKAVLLPRGNPGAVAQAPPPANGEEGA